MLLQVPASVCQPCPGSAAASLCTRLPSREASSLFEWGEAWKEDLFVSSSDNGKDISLHPLLGIALSLTKNSFSSPRRRRRKMGAGDARRGGCPQVGHLRLGTTGVTATPARFFGPCVWCKMFPRSGAVWFRFAMGSPAPFRFATAFSGSPVPWARVFNLLFYYVMDMGFVLCFGINER